MEGLAPAASKPTRRGSLSLSAAKIAVAARRSSIDANAAAMAAAAAVAAAAAAAAGTGAGVDSVATGPGVSGTPAEAKAGGIGGSSGDGSDKEGGGGVDHAVADPAAAADLAKLEAFAAGIQPSPAPVSAKPSDADGEVAGVTGDSKPAAAPAPVFSGANVQLSGDYDRHRHPMRKRSRRRNSLASHSSRASNTSRASRASRVSRLSGASDATEAAVRVLAARRAQLRVIGHDTPALSVGQLIAGVKNTRKQAKASSSHRLNARRSRSRLSRASRARSRARMKQGSRASRARSKASMVSDGSSAASGSDAGSLSSSSYTSSASSGGSSSGTESVSSVSSQSDAFSVSKPAKPRRPLNKWQAAFHAFGYARSGRTAAPAPQPRTLEEVHQLLVRRGADTTALVPSVQEPTAILAPVRKLNTAEGINRAAAAQRRRRGKQQSLAAEVMMHRADLAAAWFGVRVRMMMKRAKKTKMRIVANRNVVQYLLRSTSFTRVEVSRLADKFADASEVGHGCVFTVVCVHSPC